MHTIQILPMLPEEQKNGIIRYSFADTLFGRAIAASTAKGVCYLAFTESDEETAFRRLKSKFPHATFANQTDDFQRDVLDALQSENTTPHRINLHLKGTDFQLKVWNELLKIPSGDLSTYGRIATQIGRPKAYRAVGTAIGNNPVAYLVPCHRVVQTGGKLGGYRWGIDRKQTMIAWEAKLNEIEEA